MDWTTGYISKFSSGIVEGTIPPAIILPSDCIEIAFIFSLVYPPISVLTPPSVPKVVSITPFTSNLAIAKLGIN